MPIGRNIADYNTGQMDEEYHRLMQAGRYEDAKASKRLNHNLADIFRGINQALQQIMGPAGYQEFCNCLDNTVAVDRQITKTVSGTTITLSHSTPLATVDTLDCTRATYNSTTHVLSLYPVTMENDAEGHSKAHAEGSSTDIDLDDFGGGGGGSAVDLNEDSVNEVTGATFINLPTTNGTLNILEFVDNGLGGNLQLVAPSPATAGQIIQWNGSAWDVATPPWISEIDLKNNGSVVTGTFTSIDLVGGGIQNLMVFGGTGAAGTLAMKSSTEGYVMRYTSGAWNFVDPPWIEGMTIGGEYPTKTLGIEAGSADILEFISAGTETVALRLVDAGLGVGHKGLAIIWSGTSWDQLQPVGGDGVWIIDTISAAGKHEFSHGNPSAANFVHGVDSGDDWINTVWSITNGFEFDAKGHALEANAVAVEHNPPQAATMDRILPVNGTACLGFKVDGRGHLISITVYSEGGGVTVYWYDGTVT